MNAFITAFFCVLSVALAAPSGVWVDHGHAPVNPAAHIPSGSVSVKADGAVIAGPSGSVHTDNGLHGHGAGVNVAGPAGDIRTHAGHVELSGPGNGHGDDGAHGDDGSYGGDAWGHGGDDGAWGHEGAAGWGHGAAVVAPVVSTHLVAPVVHVAPVVVGHGIGHDLWGHGLIGSEYGHGLVGHGHHGW